MNIYINGSLHHKNQKGVELLSKCNINFDTTYNPTVKYDQIHMFNDVKNIKEQDCVHVYGPHFYHLGMAPCSFSDKEYMNCLSPWLVDLTMDIRQDIRCIALPFPVEVDKFTPSEKTGKPVIYFKHRNPNLLREVSSHFNDEFTIISYGSYREADYISHISKAPYCIWVGCHESQGFALQEAMSCGTPIFVINVRSLRDEWGPTMWRSFLLGHKLQATSASYFDNSCGFISYEESWKEDFEKFTSNLNSYDPRQYVIDNLSPQACAQKWRNIC